MPKNKKTREQKITASLRHEKLKQEQQFTYSLDSLKNSETSQLIHSEKNINANYGMDLRKSFIVSTAFLIIEIFLFLLLHRHILNIPFANY